MKLTSKNARQLYVSLEAKSVYITTIKMKRLKIHFYRTHFLCHTYFQVIIYIRFYIILNSINDSFFVLSELPNSNLKDMHMYVL